MTYDPVLDGPAGQPNSPADASALKWPVLARLPWVGEPSAIREEQRARYVEPPSEAAGRREAYAPPSLRIADTPAEPTRTYIDRAHATTQPAQPYDALPGAVAAEPLIREAASRQLRHRIDSGDARGFSASASPVRSVFLPQEEPNTLAARVFQWHATAAPYAGVVVTFLLAFSAGLLYWFTFGRPQPAPIDSNSISAPIWTSESPDPTTIAHDGWQTPDAPQDVKEFSWLKPTPAKDEAEPLKPSDDEPSKLDVPSLAAELAVEKAEPPKTEPLQSQQTEVAQAPVSEAPAATEPPASTASAPPTSAYPTTPYASFDFGLIPSVTESSTNADQSSQENLAERPADEAAEQPSTR